MKDPIFSAGDIVSAEYVDGYGNHLTKGKQYIVLGYDPVEYTENFTWPAYVTVKGDMYVKIKAHAYRFKKV